jgi:hypothetical protein
VFLFFLVDDLLKMSSEEGSLPVPDAAPGTIDCHETNKIELN